MAFIQYYFLYMNTKRIIILVLIGLLIIVSIQNVEPVKLNLLFWSMNISKLLLLILVLIFGILTGIIFSGAKKKAKQENPIEPNKE